MLYLAFGKTFQNLRVSSPAPVTMFYPHGLIAKYRTLYVWPVKVITFFIDGYFHTIIWFWEYPCVETISFVVFENTKLHTYDPVSIELIGVNFRVSQNLMHLSAVPPPVARTPDWFGFHAIALTAALWSLNLTIGLSVNWFHIINLLSLPPLANCLPSNDHLSPQTSYLWPWYLWVTHDLALRSLFSMSVSLEPDEITEPFHASELILPLCSDNSLTIFA